MQRFTAACAQFAITPMDAAANTAKAAAWTRRAVDETGAQLVVLPETVTTGFVPDVGPDGLWDMVDALPGRFSEPLQGVAQALGVYVVFPSYERGAERGIVYNSAALIGPIGRCAGHLSQDAPVPHRTAHSATASESCHTPALRLVNPRQRARRDPYAAGLHRPVRSATTAISRSCSARWRSWARR